MQTTLPIVERKGAFYLRKTFEGKTREISLGKNAKEAKTKGTRFLATAEKSGWETALDELRGKKVLKAGCNPTFDDMKELYKDYCDQSPKSPRESTIRVNLNRLKVIMERGEFKRVGDINQATINKTWFKSKTRTPTEQRTFASAINAAGGIFKVNALAYYKTRGFNFINPFKGMEKSSPRVSAYSPMSEETRKSIWFDCQTELAPWDAMVVLLCLGAGLRRSEVCAAIPSWFSQQANDVILTVKEESHFQPKEEETGTVPITIELYKTLLKLRGDSKSKFFVPSPRDNEGANRLNKRYEKIIKWLKSKGLNDHRPIHALRKEMGSLIAKKESVLEASKILRNTLAVCSKVYAGIADTKTVDMEGSFQTPVHPLQATADSLGITLEQLQAKLAEMA